MTPKFYNEGATSDQGYDVAENDCPVCGSEQSLTYGGLSARLKTIVIPWKCEVCQSVGEEAQDAVFSGHMVIKENSLESRDND